MQAQAELLKTRFGKAIAAEANPNEIVSIPGLKNRAPKEISSRNLASIIQARMEEIIEIVQNEIMQSGYYKKLAGGIVLTGGGSQMQFISQLFEYMTGLDTRIGFPNEHLGKSVLEDVKSPMYATTVGLVLAGFKSLDMREEIYQNRRANSGVKPKQVVTRDKISKDFFKNIGERLKGIISDDIGDDTAYGN
jgi:cell division protein FtsA